MLNRISHIQKNTQYTIKFMTSWGKKKKKTTGKENRYWLPRGGSTKKG